MEPGQLRGLDEWLTTTPEDRAHDVYCNCRECHEGHVESGEYREMAEGTADFWCCVDKVMDEIAEGKICGKHPTAYSEPGYCEVCDGV